VGKKEIFPPEEWPADFQKLFHELQTHQIELELQNEELRRVQEELSLALDKYTDLYDLAPVGYLTLSPKGIIKRANLSFASMLQRERGTLAGRPLSAFVHADDQDIFYQTQRKLAEGMERQTMELQLRTSTGAWFFARMEGLPMAGRDGAPPSIQVAVSDISELQQIRLKLLHNLEKLDSIIESTGDGILVVDSAGKIIHANQRFYRMWRIPAELQKTDIDKKLLHQVLDQLQSPYPFLEKVRQLYTTNETDSDFLFFKDGRVFERCSRALVKDRVIMGRVWSFRDVTQQKQAEARLTESEERFRTLFEQAAVGVAIVEAGTGKFLRINRKFGEIVGYSPEELFGKNFQTITHPDDLEPDLDQMRKVEEGRIHQVSMEKRYIRKDGTIVWVKLTSSRMWKENEAPTTFVAVVEDISKSKQTETLLNEYRQLLEQRVAERTEQLTTAALSMQDEIRVRKQTEKELRQSEAKLERQKTQLEEINTTLTVLLKNRDTDRRDLEEQVVGNVKQLAVPFVHKLKKSGLNSVQKNYLAVLEDILNDIIAPFLRTVSAQYLKLTPAEIQVANLVKQGMATKEIAELLNLSACTINIHRRNLRKKLGISGQNKNLQSFLATLDNLT
jgi:PAS domain S-box-containing protein